MRKYVRSSSRKQSRTLDQHNKVSSQKSVLEILQCHRKKDAAMIQEKIDFSPYVQATQNIPQALENVMYLNTHLNSQQIIQKRDPEDKDLRVGEILTHGSQAKKFLKDVANPSSDKKDTPDAPAWLAEDDEAFSIHATLHMRSYKAISGPTPLYVHIYTPKNNIELNSWDYYGYVPEYILRKKSDPNYSKQNLDTTKTTKGSMEERVINMVLADSVLSEDEKKAMAYVSLNDEDLSWNTKEAATEIKPLIPGKDGYHIEHDLVLNKPEDILFDSGLNKLESTETREFMVRQNSKGELEVLDSASRIKYKYNPSVISSFKKV